MSPATNRVESGQPVFIGIDGGGTGCRARIENEEGDTLGEGVSGPAAVRIGIDRSRAAIEAASRAAAANAGRGPDWLSAMHACVGVAGINRKGAREALLAWRHPFQSITFVNDATIACVGAHGGRDGGIVVVGTGSIGFALVDGGEVRFGGYGFPISDEGSGADLGLEAIRIALRAIDGREQATDFTREIIGQFGHDPFEVVAWADRATATDYAAFAPAVTRHAESGDPAARRIMQGAAGQIDALVRRLLDTGVSRIALVGGLAPLIQPWLPAHVTRHIVPAEADAVAGALHLARQSAMVPSW